MLKNKIKKKHEHKERKKNNHATPYESFKFGLVFQTHNLWNLQLGSNQEAPFLSNLKLKDEIEKIFQSRKFANVKKIKRIRTKFNIKIKSNQMLRDKIKNSIQLKK